MNNELPSRARLHLIFIVLCVAAGCSAAPKHLRVCADPNNLPFSNHAENGFENKLAELIAAELKADVRYTWWAQRRGFVRNTLNERKCDVIMGVPGSFELTATTRPYYRSTYVFVSRRDRQLDIDNFDDPRLRELRIGVQLIGDDYAATPPAHALTKRGLVRNVVGYSVYGDYAQPNPPARIIDAVVKGDVDIAVVWGPLAGYFARQSVLPLDLRPVTPQIEPPFLPMVFDIALGVRRSDVELQRVLNDILLRRRADIDRLLEEYGVPRVGQAGSAELP